MEDPTDWSWSGGFDHCLGQRQQWCFGLQGAGCGKTILLGGKVSNKYAFLPKRGVNVGQVFCEFLWTETKAHLALLIDSQNTGFAASCLLTKVQWCVWLGMKTKNISLSVHKNTCRSRKGLKPYHCQWCLHYKQCPSLSRFPKLSKIFKVQYVHSYKTPICPAP